MSGVTCHTADYIDVNIATANDTAAPCSNTGSKFKVGGDVALHLQVLNDTMHTDVAEECRAVLTLVEHVDCNGVTRTVEDSLEVLSVATNHGNVFR